MVRGLLCRDEVKTIGVGTAQESRRYQSRSVVANPVPLRRRSGAPDARPAETGAGHGPVPANSLQGYSGRRRRDASVLDADTLQDPIVSAGRMWKLIPLTPDHPVWMAETKVRGELAFDAVIESYALKYEKAADCLSKDRDTLLAFYDFPAEHWKHLRTTNPIESTFATVRPPTIRSKGCLSNGTALAMVFKLVEGAQKSWRRLDGHNQLPKLILGVTFADGIEVIAKATDRQPTTAAPCPARPSPRFGDSSIDGDTRVSQS